MLTSAPPTRRTSSRLRQTATKADQPDEADSDTSSIVASAPKPARKKQKVSKSKVEAPKANGDVTVTAAESAKQKAVWAKVKGRRGRLKMVVEMPFDILLEIFQYLPPADLLCLTKASKSLRTLLLDRATAFPLWKYAFDTLDSAPPACPSDLNLPQYANLLYTRTCHYCDSARGLTRVWHFYTVVCKSCFAEQFVSPPWSPEHREITIILNGFRVFRKDRNGTFYLKSEYERHAKALSRIRVNEVRERQAYIAEEARKLAPRQGRIHEFNAWESQQSRHKKFDIETRRTNRSYAFKEKLKELGYDDVLPSVTRWDGSLMHDDLPQAKGVKPLTEREWAKIKPEVVDVLDRKRREIQVDKREKLLRDRSELLTAVYQYYISRNRAYTGVAPSSLEVAKTEPFRTLIYDTPSDKQLTQADFLAHLDELPKIFDSWRQKTTSFLYELIPQSVPIGQSSGKAKQTLTQSKGRGKGKEREKALVDTAIFDLATTLFECSSCQAVLPYHPALTHNCFVSSQPALENPTIEEIADPNVLWNQTGAVKYHQVASDCVREIINILGKDPKTVTGQDLDETRQRLECKRCRLHTPSGKPKRSIMDWRNAVVHEVLFHRSEEPESEQKQTKSTPKWEVVKGKLLTAVYKREMFQGAPGKETWRGLLCVQCNLWELDEKNGEVQRVRTGSWTSSDYPISPGENTCVLRHDMAMGTYRRGYPSFEPSPLVFVM